MGESELFDDFVELAIEDGVHHGEEAGEEIVISGVGVAAHGDLSQKQARVRPMRRSSWVFSVAGVTTATREAQRRNSWSPSKEIALRMERTSAGRSMTGELR